MGTACGSCNKGDTNQSKKDFKKKQNNKKRKDTFKDLGGGNDDDMGIPAPESRLRFESEKSKNVVADGEGVDLVNLHIEHEDRVKMSALQMEHRKSNRKVTRPTISGYAPFFEGIAWWKSTQQEINLDDFAGRRVVLMFYQKDFISHFPDQIKEFANQRETFDKMNTQLIVCSPDSLYILRSFATKMTEQNGSSFLSNMVLLSDQIQFVGKKYGVLDSADPDNFVSAFFIVDELGKLRYSSVLAGTEDMSANKVITEILAIKEGNGF